MDVSEGARKYTLRGMAQAVISTSAKATIIKKSSGLVRKCPSSKYPLYLILQQQRSVSRCALAPKGNRKKIRVDQVNDVAKVDRSQVQKGGDDPPELNRGREGGRKPHRIPKTDEVRIGRKKKNPATGNQKAILT